MTAKVSHDDKILAAAGGFTGLWAITWLGASMMGAGGAAAQGAFGVGAVMGGSGLTALWWKARTLQAYHASDEDAENDSHVGRAEKSA